MFVCSVSTVVFNGNPLLRYDGYYILADILEIPNLRQKATTILSRKMGTWFLGLEEPDDPFLPKRNQAMFALYSVAAATYSWVVMVSILFFLFKVFEPYRLEVIGQMIAVASIASMIGRPLWSVGKFFYVPGRVDDVKKPRLYATLGVLGVIILAFLFLPLPYHLFCALEVQPHNPDQVYVKVDGQLDEIGVEPGETVKTGQGSGRYCTTTISNCKSPAKKHSSRPNGRSSKRCGLQRPIRKFVKELRRWKTILSASKRNCKKSVAIWRNCSWWRRKMAWSFRRRCILSR